MAHHSGKCLPFFVPDDSQRHFVSVIRRKFDYDYLEERLKRQGKMEAFAGGENGACFWSQGGSTWGVSFHSLSIQPP